MVSEGTCQQPAQLDEECVVSYSTPSFSTCALDLYCEGIEPETSSTGLCRTEPQAGEACGTGFAIHSEGGDYCPLPMVCLDGLCTARSFIGQSCTSDEQCESGLCEGTCMLEPYCE